MQKTILLSLFVLLAGCATGLEPADSARETAGPGEGAVGRVQGVTVEARTDAWSGTPENLAAQVTPILVTVSNRSARPLRIRYDAFQLVGRDRRFAVLPPMNVEGEVTAPAAGPAWPATGFYVAPYMSPWYTGLDPWEGPFDPNPGYYGTYHRRFAEIELPTGDMLRMALPEGVLDPNGEVTGFLYFEDVGPQVERVTFTARLVDAGTGETFGQVNIPFTTEPEAVGYR